MTVGELRELLTAYGRSEPVRVYSPELSQMFEVVGVSPGEEHTYSFAEIDVITKELGE